MNLQKCADVIKSQANEIMTTASKNICSKTQEKLAQNLEPSKVWAKLDSKASAFLGKIRKQELGKLLEDFKGVSQKLGFENYGKPAFCGFDKYDEFVSLNGDFYEYADYFVSKLQTGSDEAKEALRILKQMNDRSGVRFVGVNTKANEQYTQIFNDLLKNL
ncbi:MAG: hypothetical protein IJB79_04105 [Candidatus Gastranaerophilales bacterium]|nr:hypothetical protein [Candidatus Gastranaerophilales bacterium]